MNPTNSICPKGSLKMFCPVHNEKGKKSKAKQ